MYRSVCDTAQWRASGLLANAARRGASGNRWRRFQAVARIVAAEGEQALTTNRIAEVAGISVGSLYQYFPTKDAVLTAMAFRYRESVLEELERLLDDAAAAALPLEQRVRLYMRRYLEAFGGTTSEQRALIRLCWKLDYHEAILDGIRCASERVAVHLHRMAGADASGPTPAQLFVLTRGFSGVVRAAALEDSPLLGGRELEDELVRLCVLVCRFRGE